MVEHNSDSFFD